MDDLWAIGSPHGSFEKSSLDPKPSDKVWHVEHKRDNVRPDNRRPRRKKRKKGAGGPPEREASQPSKQSPPINHQKRPSSSRPQQERRKEPVGDKGPKSKAITATPRDLRLGSPGKGKLSQDEAPFRHVTRRYGVAIYESFAAAKADKETIATKAKEVDQFNIVIRAEGNMDDAELLALGPVKIFAGSAWTLIHERRIQDGWYDTPR